MQNLIRVDASKCTKCGLCVNDCPYVVLTLDPEKGPLASREACVSCGHCVSICPYGAIDNINAPLAAQKPLAGTLPKADELEYLFQSRRSTRWFADQPVPGALTMRLLEVARRAPSGSNSQGISYIVIENRETLRQISATVIDWGKSALEDDLPINFLMYGLIERYGKGLDSILFNAPTLIVTVGAARESFKRVRENSIFALFQAQLMAETLGLGSCWAGVLEGCAFAGCLPLLRLLDIPESMTFTGALALGYPKHRHQRIPERNPLQVVWKR